MLVDILFYISLLFMPVAYGFGEQWIARKVGAGWSGSKFIGKHFSAYHVLMLLFFILFQVFIATLFFMAFGWGYYFLLKSLTFMPMAILIEDLSYFYFHPKDGLSEDDWINWKFGGFSIFGKWIPTVYLVLALAYSVVINILQFVGML